MDQTSKSCGKCGATQLILDPLEGFEVCEACGYVPNPHELSLEHQLISGDGVPTGVYVHDGSGLQSLAYEGRDGYRFRSRDVSCSFALQQQDLTAMADEYSKLLRLPRYAEACQPFIPGAMDCEMAAAFASTLLSRLSSGCLWNLQASPQPNTGLCAAAPRDGPIEGIQAILREGCPGVLRIHNIQDPRAPRNAPRRLRCRPAKPLQCGDAIQGNRQRPEAKSNPPPPSAFPFPSACMAPAGIAPQVD